MRKRQKKDHDKTWKHEERRSSGDHRRSGGQQAARRASAGRRRDWNSDESSDGSSPPALNDGTVFSCCVLPVDLTFVLTAFLFKVVPIFWLICCHGCCGSS